MKLNKNWKQRLAAAAAFAVVVAGQASAAIPEGYTTMLTSLGADAKDFIEDVYLAIGGIAIVGVIGAIAIKGLKKGKGAV